MMGNEVSLYDVAEVNEAKTRGLLPDEIEPEVLVGYHVVQIPLGRVETRPYDVCPHCRSYDYRLVKEAEQRFAWLCRRCDLRRPPEKKETG